MNWLDELDAAAEKATPGPWIRCGVRRKIGNEDCLMIGPDGFSIAMLPIGRKPNEHAGAFNDAGYIAACSPERIRALIACVRAAKVVSEENMCMSTPGLVAFDAAYAALDKL